MAPRVTYQQLEALVDFLEENPGIAKGLMKTVSGKETAKRKWKELAQVLNAMGGAIKTGESWSKYWTERKSSIKTKCALTNKSFNKTGGGTDTTAPLGSLELRIVEVMGGQGFFSGDTELQRNPFPKQNEVPESDLEVTIEDIGDDISDDNPPTQTTNPPTQTTNPPTTQTTTQSTNRPLQPRNREPSRICDMDLAMDRLSEVEMKRVQAETISAKASADTAAALHRIAAALESLTLAVNVFACQK